MDEWEYDEIDDEDMRDYLDRIRLRRSENDFHRTKDALRKFTGFLEYIGADSYEEVGVEELEIYIDYLLEDGLNDTSIKKVYLSQVTNFLKKKGVVRDSIHDKLDTEFLSDESIASRQGEEDVHYVTKEEYVEMLEATETLRENLTLRLLWETGVRRGEAVGIKLEHIDRDKKQIYVDNLKNDDDRYVYYTSHLSRKLREWLDMGGREQYSKAAESEYLLISNQSVKLQDKRINEKVKEIAKRTENVGEVIGEDAMDRELYKPTAHSFRHSFAIHRVRSGMPINFLKELMGHMSVETTEFYLNFREQDIKEINEGYAPRVNAV
ncbi:tyrosine-type recombinase/integrase [Haladaptatus sp. F3-133]|uniref:Tyrosine-type recombinase/integrase n=1 Tax=Halorutilus salinus TaxID=2487751 RepID=A0A9Q4C360_9EURY|nr:tyrosine-type recombinase/integrase [Halorutilus salinus]MCX2818110.1 tyrosine-type recombinase/integrase [Halorutilus salinus]